MATIVTKLGLYKFKYLPYGVNTGPGSFQRLMCKKLSGIQNVFIDNNYMSGKDLNDMTKTLCKVLSKLKESEFKLKIEKCKLYNFFLNVFGIKVDKTGLGIIQDNVLPLLKTPSPTNLTLLKSCLGKNNYYSRFLKDMAKVLAPLYNCLRKKKLN